MKKLIIILLCLFISFSIYSQEKLYIYKNNNTTLGAPVATSDTIYFSGDKSNIFFKIGDNLKQFPLVGIDSLVFAPESDTVFITYHESWVSVVNPFAFEGVDVEVNASDVKVIHTSDIKDINYCLSGSTTDGSFKIYSEKRFNLLLNNLSLTNPDGPAINSQSTNKATIILLDGTNNTLSDGASYAAAPLNQDGETEDQKATLFCEGSIVLKGSGNLTINSFGAEQHALASDDDIEFQSGILTISSAVKDGIHGKDGFVMTGGSIKLTASGDGIDGDEGFVAISGGEIEITSNSADVSGIKCDSLMTISGGIIDLYINGNQSKGFNCDSDITFSDGTIVINTKGNAVLETDGSGYDPSYCTGIKSDNNVNINGGNITITSTGNGGKGISTDGVFNMNSGILQITTSGSGATYKNSSGTTDAYQSTCISSDGNIFINSGTVTTSSSGKAGRGISSDAAISIGTTTGSPTISVTTTGTSITISGQDKAEAKAFKADGSFTVNNGSVTISSADDGIKSTTSITINGGNVNITKSVEGIESPLITINGGNTSVVSSDDALNGTYGNGGEQNDGSLVKITNGFVVLNASNGDALDSNGSLEITGGTIISHGPSSQPEVGMDVNGTKKISGGLVVITGPNSNMTETFDNTSSQYSVMIKSQQSISSSTLFHIQDASGNDIVTFKGVRNYNSLLFSSPALTNGATYSIYTGGSSTGTQNNGLYSGGAYSGGTLKKSFTVNSKVMNVTM